MLIFSVLPAVFLPSYSTDFAFQHQQVESQYSLGSPIRQYRQGLVTPGSIVTGEVDAKIVHAIHSFMHHELHVKGGRSPGFECHRTDGRSRGSAPLQNFNIGGFTEAQGLVTYIGEGELDFHRPSKLDITQVHFFPVHLQAG